MFRAFLACLAVFLVSVTTAAELLPLAELPEPSAIVLLSLNDQVIRVVMQPMDAVEQGFGDVEPRELMCDIGICPMLAERSITAVDSSALPTAPSGPTVIRRDRPAPKPVPQAAPAYMPERIALVAPNLKIGPASDIVFAHGSADFAVGVQARLLLRSDTVMLELRPKYVLPSGSIESLTVTHANRKKRQLETLYAQASHAKAALPQLTSDYARVKSELATAVGRANARSRVAPVPQNSVRANQLRALGLRLENQVFSAESLVAQIPAITKDADALDAVVQYASRIKDQSAIYIRFHNGRLGTTLPAIKK